MPSKRQITGNLGRMIVLAVFALAGNAAVADVLFKDAFDTQEEGASLRAGPVPGDSGIWSLNNQGDGQVLTTAAVHLSPALSLALETPNQGDQAQAVACLSQGGEKAPTERAILAKFAFLMPNSEALVVIVVRDTGDANLATIRLRGGDPVKVSFRDHLTDLGNISPGTWYRLEISLPAQPGSTGNEEFSVTLREAGTQSEIASASGLLSEPPAMGEYAYLTIYQANTQGGSGLSYFDDFLIETVE